jgi:hypothetical protein
MESHFGSLIPSADDRSFGLPESLAAMVRSAGLRMTSWGEGGSRKFFSEFDITARSDNWIVFEIDDADLYKSLMLRPPVFVLP